MTSIPQRFKQMCIAANASAIFGRAGTCSIQATWDNHILVQGANIFYCNHVSPTISKIVFVDKASTYLTSDLLEPYASLILHPVAIFWIWLSIVCFADDDLMQMTVLPPHVNMEHPIQRKDIYLIGNHNASRHQTF